MHASITRPRSVGSVEAAVRALSDSGALDIPLPGHGATPERWAALAAWGRGDLALARVVEGHTDAVAILAEAGRRPVPGFLYGVWAARSGGTGAALRSSGEGSGAGMALDGTVRFCSGAHLVDRALVVADAPAGGKRLLVDVAVAPPHAVADPGSWCTSAMESADTLDVRFDALPVRPADLVGPPGWYVGRPGFAAGGGGVAAVWWGGASGLLDRAITHLPAEPDAHQLAHVGELHALLEAGAALLERTATAVDTEPGGDHTVRVAGVRSAVERVAREVLDRVPRMLGPAPLSRDAALARTLADLGIFVRQHHAERDHAALGALVLADRAVR